MVVAAAHANAVMTTTDIGHPSGTPVVDVSFSESESPICITRVNFKRQLYQVPKIGSGNPSLASNILEGIRARELKHLRKSIERPEIGSPDSCACSIANCSGMQASSTESPGMAP